VGRRERALTSYDRAIALKPDLAEAHANAGNILAALGRGVLQCFEIVVLHREIGADKSWANSILNNI